MKQWLSRFGQRLADLLDKAEGDSEKTEGP
jgi:hypothetical protein